jgi:hypothetical protein
VETQLSRDSSGRLVLQVRNRSGAALSQVAVDIETVDASGRQRRFRNTLEHMAPGAATLMLVADDSGDLVDARAAVVAARIEE